MIILSPNRLTFFVSWLVLGSWSPYNISLCFLCCACIMSLYGECFFWPCPPCLSPEAYRRLSLGVLHPSVFFSVVCLSLLVSALHSGLLLPVQCSGRHLFLAKSCSCSLVFSLSAGSSINLPLICYSAGHSPLFLVHCWFPGCWTSFFLLFVDFTLIRSLTLTVSSNNSWATPTWLFFASQTFCPICAVLSVHLDPLSASHCHTVTLRLGICCWQVYK